MVDLVRAIGEAVDNVRDVDPHKFHEAVRDMYAWSDVAERTERVYSRMTRTQVPPLIERLRRFVFCYLVFRIRVYNNSFISYYGCGVWAGKIFCIMVAIDYLFLILLSWLVPQKDIDHAPDFIAFEKSESQLSLRSESGKTQQKQLN